MQEGQDIKHIRGDDLLISVSVTLDQSRALDGNETYKWALKTNAEGHALVSKTTTSGITLDSSTHQPTVALTPSDFPTSNFPNSINNKVYVHELEMTRGNKVETVLRGTFTLVSDIA